MRKWSCGLFLIAASLLLISNAALADSLKLVGTPGPHDTGFYTGPYQIKDISTNAGFLGFCDDFTTNVTVGTTWTANVYTLANLKLLKFGASDPGGLLPTNLLKEYQAAFYLTDQLAAVPNTLANVDQIDDLTWAIWGIFSAAARGASGYDSDASQLATGALARSFGPTQYFNRLIYTPLPLSASQEYLTAAPVPEPATLALVGTGLIGLAAGLIRRRLRK